MRIVSVLPSATEIVYALGHGEELVGRSVECDFPSAANSLPVVMRPRAFDSDRPSKEIDRRVQETRGRGESLYELDLALLRELSPELLLTQDLCGVCSVTDQEVTDACRVAGIAPRILSLSPTTLEGVWNSVEEVGEAIHDRARAEQLAASLRSRSHRSPAEPSRVLPRVAVVEWLEPPILAGLWTPDIVRAAGGEPVGVRSGTPGVRTTWNEIAETHPDLVILSPCSFSVGRTRKELEAHELSATVAAIPAHFGTWIVDEAYFSRPGPRLASGVDVIRQLLSPERSTATAPTDGVSAFLVPTENS